MKRLLLLGCGIASAVSLGMSAARAEVKPMTPSQRLPYSQPIDGGLLAQATMVDTACMDRCAEPFTRCRQANHNDDSTCKGPFQSCTAPCKR
jgi:hypothetical protein